VIFSKIGDFKVLGLRSERTVSRVNPDLLLVNQGQPKGESGLPYADVLMSH
jgi:hypothetical protein